jgi:hypothetical protein
MFRRISKNRSGCFYTAVLIACLIAKSAAAQTAREVRGAAAVEPLQNEPPAKIIIDPPLAESLSHGRVVIQYRTENLHLEPVFGHAALAVSPRVGHIHVNLDDAPWVWVDSRGEPVILNGLPSGPHKLRLELRNANHQLLGEASVRFTMPQVLVGASGVTHTASEVHGTAAAQPIQSGFPAKLVIDPPLAEPLSRGVLFIQYRAENLHIVPLFGSAALAVSPRVGHIHVTVDNAPWHWADASGNPVIISGLAPGQHKVLFQLVNPDHQPIDQVTLQVTVPAEQPHEAAH